jgi:predicted flap endonuclease-1-like 5' DNA nuclease
MDNNSLVGIILVVVVLLILLYAIYYVSQQRKKKSIAPVTKPVSQAPVVAAPVQATPEPKPVPQTPAIVTPVQPAQAPVVAAPVQTAVTEGEVKTKQIESQAIKSSVAPTPTPKLVTQAPAAAAPVQPAQAPKPATQAPVAATPVQPAPAPKPMTQAPAVATAVKSSAEHRTTTTDRGSKIIDIEGIGPVYAAKLNSVNIKTTSDLLKAGETPLMRRELAEKTGISHNLILRWVNMSDLFRIRGVGEEYSDLLEASGVDTVVELAKRVPEHLHARMLELNVEKKLVRRPPGLSMVESWVSEAKTLPRKIEY